MPIQSAPVNFKRNFFHLYADIAWYGILAASTLAFTSVYATRLGASAYQISILSAGPALVSLLLALPAGRWLQGRPLIPTTFLTAVIQRLGFFLIILLPWFFTQSAQIWAILIITLLSSLPGTLLAIAFSATLAEAAPDPYRVDVVSRRNAILAASTMTTSLLCGQLLNSSLLPFPLNYQVVFALGALGAGMSTYHLARLRASPAPSKALQPVSDGDERALGQPAHTPAALVRMDLLRGPYGRLMAAFLIFYIFQNFGLPLFPVYNVRVLALTDWEIGLGSFLFYLLTFVVSLQLSRMTRRYGHHRLLVLSALLLGLYPFLLSQARDATFYWVASVLGGVVWAVLNVSIFNRLLERCPPDDLPAHLAIHTLVQSLGALVGSLLGPAVAGHMGFVQALLVCAALRMVAGAILARWG
jgi:MFS family permease